MRANRGLPLALAAAVAAGCVKQATHARALDQIAELEARLSDSQRESAERESRITGLEQELLRLQGALAAATSGQQLGEAEVARVRGEKAATEAELDELRRQRDVAEQRLSSYRDLQRRFQGLVDAGALAVRFRNGQMTVELPSGVLFSPGAAALSAEGKATIARVTEVLLAFQDRRFLVAGHTDDVPIKTRAFRNNWMLSAARAVAVVDDLVAAGFPAARLAAAGYADVDPVGDNATEAGRAQNRRIEIIVVPDLSELPQLTEEPR